MCTSAAALNLCHSAHERIYDVCRLASGAHMRQHLNAPGAVDVAKGSRGQHSKSKLVLRNHHWRHSFCGLSKARQQLPVGAPVVRAQLPEAL